MDAVSSNPDVRKEDIRDDPVPPMPPSRQVLVDLEEMLKRSTERLQGEMMETRIHRFPHDLMRGIGGTDNRYVVPSVVAIGPYHHGRPHLLPMEEVKQAEANIFCSVSGRSVEEVYMKVFSVAGAARSCYDSSVTADNLTDAEFAAMMFLDGCFLLRYLDIHVHAPDQLLLRCKMSSGPDILRDIFLLENQIPWLVLEALMEFKDVDVALSVIAMAAGLFNVREKKRWRMPWEACLPDRPVDDRSGGGCYKPPPHLLGLLRFILICGMPADKRESKSKHKDMPMTSMSIGAIGLLQIGLKLTASTATWFADIDCQKNLVLGEVHLSTLFLNDHNACWLVNMAALETVQPRNTLSYESDGYVVSSYLSMMAMLMDREEDVHELRRRGILCSNFSNTQTLTFFKGLGQHLRLGYNYFNTLRKIEGYIHGRPVRNAAHKFVYNNYKVIAAVLSVAGVLVSILKALYSLKKP